MADTLAQEKAKELIDKFDLPSGLMSSERKQCALITCGEIISVMSANNEFYYFDESIEFWQEVKAEIEKL